MKAKELSEAIEMPDNIEAKVDNRIINIKGQKGEVKKTFLNLNIQVKQDNKKIIFYCKTPTKREKKIIGTFKAHIRNMIKGVNEGHKYILKICSGHFPMNISVNNKEFTVKNFLGEKIPRVLKINEGVNVKVDGDLVIVEGIDKDITGQLAASIEQLCKIKNKDLRIFQDGIWLCNKDGKEIK